MEFNMALLRECLQPGQDCANYLLLDVLPGCSLDQIVGRYSFLWRLRMWGFMLHFFSWGIIRFL